MPSEASTAAASAPIASAVVVGGGLAGIAAAVKLADAGVRVTLVETRQRLGGRATSFTDPSTGQTLDNCQHVLLGCCTNLLGLYKRLGVDSLIQWHRRLYFTDSSGAVDVLEADRLPAPLHMTRSLWAFKTLTARQKLAISRGMLAIMRTRREQLGNVTFRDWLREIGQPDEAIRKFWSVIVIGAINEWPERMAASHALQVFQEGFLANQDAYVMGLSAVPLVRLYDEAERVIRAAGGQVLLSSSAEALTFDGKRVAALRIARGQDIQADAFVSALPFDRLDKLCDPRMREADPRLRTLGHFVVSPIIGIHLWFDPRTVRMDLPHLVLMESPLQWVFNKGLERQPENAAQDASPPSSKSQASSLHLHGVISAAHDLVDEPAEAIIDMAVREVRRSLPGNGGADAKLLHARVIKEKRATFSAGPGIDAMRPEARGAIPNLYLAGDWCRTGWPATMEGAVRSGYLAAAALLRDAAREPRDTLVPDLRPGGLYRLIARRAATAVSHA